LQQFSEDDMTIPDYKVEAAAKRICETASTGRHTCSLKMGKPCFCGYTDERVSGARAALEAADAAQEPPQIEVTGEMEQAGADAVVALHRSTPEDQPFSRPAIRVIYRAMRALEPKPEAKPVYRRLPGPFFVSDERSGKERRGPTDMYAYGKRIARGGPYRNAQRRQTQGDER
jgi:hypothetical protein